MSDPRGTVCVVAAIGHAPTVTASTREFKHMFDLVLCVSQTGATTGHVFERTHVRQEAS